MKTIRDIPHLDGVKVLVRVDFNVPIANAVVADDFRIRMALPTIDFLLGKGATVILIAHLESEHGGVISLKPVAECLSRLGKPVTFVKDIRQAHEVIEHRSGDVDSGDKKCILIENLRFFEGEKGNDDKFSKELASLGDVFVNEAFPVSHREHASIVSVPRFMPSYAGLQLEKEVKNLSMVFDPPHPFIFLLNGSKFETKLPLLEKFMGIADVIFVGGALATDFLKKKGYEVGRSLVSGGDVDLSPYINDPKVIIPIDVIDEGNTAWPVDQFPANAKIVDVGPKTIEILREKIGQAKCILWNGTLGLYEDGYAAATLELAKIIADAAQNGAISIIGGGDTVAAIEKLGIGDRFTFVSTGGGAMLDFLAKGTLSGIEALEKSEG